MQPRKHLWTTCSVLLMAALLAACAAPAAAPAPPADTPMPPTDTPAPPAATSDPVAVVQAWVEALNSGDVDAVLAHMTDDISFAVWEYYATGKEDLRRWILDWWVGLDTEYKSVACEPEENEVSCAMNVVDGCIAAFGATEGLPTKITFVVQPDGKISKVTGRLDGARWNDYFGSWSPPAQAWMRVNRAEELTKIDPNPDRKQAGALQIKLCRDYEAAVKIQEPATAAAAQGLVDAINSGDTDAALALFTESDETKFRAMSDEVVGAEQMGAMFDYLAGKEAQLQITDCEWQGISTQCAVSLVDGCIAVSGVPDGLHGKMTFYSEEDGTLRQVIVVPAAAERKPYEAWLEAESAWTSANRADELAQAEGYSQEAGAMSVKLCQEYAAAAETQAQDPTNVVQAWLEALNNGDLDAALALMTPDAKMSGIFTGPTTNVLDFWIGLTVKHGVPNCLSKGSQLECGITMSDDGCIAASGDTDGLPVQYTFTFQDGMIQEVYVDVVDWENYGEWLGEEGAWASANRAEEWAQTDGFSREAGAMSVKLCQEYAETLK